VFNENWELIGIHMGSKPAYSNYCIVIDDLILDAKNRLVGKSVPDDVAEAIRGTIRVLACQEVTLSGLLIEGSLLGEAFKNLPIFTLFHSSDGQSAKMEMAAIGWIVD
jgi:hypothetical protein